MSIDHRRLLRYKLVMAA